MCEICQNWCRTGLEAFNRCNKKYITTNHHINCPHYNDSLIDVWSVTYDGVTTYVDNESDANSTSENGTIVTKLKMHKEIFDNLPEFEGF